MNHTEQMERIRPIKPVKPDYSISIRLTREQLRAQRLHELADIFESAFEVQS
jgi:hypothetical protein